MADRNAEAIRTEIADERRGLEGDLGRLRGDVRRFGAFAAGIAVAAVAALIALRVAVRLLFRRS